MEALKYLGGVLAIASVATAASWNAISDGSAAQLLHNLSTPGSGVEKVLPKEIRNIVAFLHANHITSIRLSAAVLDNRFIDQPLTEGAYPITVRDSAKVLVSYASEPLPAGYQTLKIEKGIRIAARP